MDKLAKLRQQYYIQQVGEKTRDCASKNLSRPMKPKELSKVQAPKHNISTAPLESIKDSTSSGNKEKKKGGSGPALRARVLTPSPKKIHSFEQSMQVGREE
mmetsp:Transcript_26479/g.40427  ORF Transcript_26479/g.40427 Transcript_26479/m.40427 type:complete len:101 (+) Transcript_26479:208-510(+)